MDWIEQNKQWFLSGAGIFLISSIVSFCSVLLTLWWKAKIEKSKKKKLKISSAATKFQTQTTKDIKGIGHDKLKISYMGREFENLCCFSVKFENIGSCAIENQKIHLVVPADADIVDFFERRKFESIIQTKSEIASEKTTEIIFNYERLEPKDSCVISYLVNIKDISLIKCEPRGVDGISYLKDNDIDTSDINKLVLYIATFVFANTVPWAGSFIQALLILISAPIIIDIARNYLNFKKINNNIININNGIDVNKDGVITINQLIN